jgi:SHS2 domain-containing protein
MGYRWLEHTSELELSIDACSESAVFELALEALGELASERVQSEDQDGGCIVRHGGREVITREIAVEASDRAALLASFLDELVYLLETDDMVPEQAERLQLLGQGLTATVRGHRGTPRHVVKGVTYHKLKFAPVGERFAATVVLDV